MLLVRYIHVNNCHSYLQAVYTSALLAAGSTLELTHLVCDGKLRNGITVVR